MEEQIARFAGQFAWEPVVEHAEKLPAVPTRLIVCGMGGSHLGADLLLTHDPTLPVTIHRDYGLPRVPRADLEGALIVASSYSGTTEETLDAAQAALEAGLALAVVTTGGALADLARAHGLPLILLPDTHIEPRMAVGLSMLALARLLGDVALERAIAEAGRALDPDHGRAEAAALVTTLRDTVPLIYASTQNFSIAYFWKIAMNETGKIPAGYNLFPELCHNELSGYDAPEASQALSQRFHVLMLTDESDHPRIKKRMRIMQGLLAARGVAVTAVPLSGATALEKALHGVLAGVWTALGLASAYGAPDAATPLVAEFKQKMAEPES
jgi:glucose/mannose-6-phosphate isomerase